MHNQRGFNRWVTAWVICYRWKLKSNAFNFVGFPKKNYTHLLNITYVGPTPRFAKLIKGVSFVRMGLNSLVYQNWTNVWPTLSFSEQIDYSYSCTFIYPFAMRWTAVNSIIITLTFYFVDKTYNRNDCVYSYMQQMAY